MWAKLIIVTALILSNCDSNSGTNTGGEMNAELVSQNFILDQIEKPLKPFATLSADTLEIHDYWAVIQEGGFIASLSIIGDTISIVYSVASITIRDWTPTVEAILKIKISSPSDSIVLKVGAAPSARIPTDLEVGFRDARTEYVEVLN